MHLRNVTVIALIGSIAIPFSALAQEDLQVEVLSKVSCAEVSFDVGMAGGSPLYALDWDFGDGESLAEADVASPHTTSHTYPGAGEFAWSLLVSDGAAAVGSAQGTVVIDGPTVTLTSDPFPPLLTLNEGQASASFTADTTGGLTPYVYTWDLDGDGNADEAADPSANVSTFTYDAAGKYVASVTVQDACGLTTSDTLPVLVEDSTDTQACHPMAQRIADAVNALFPSQAEDLYTCEDIFSYFEGGLTGSQLGFGRMWHAYQLTQTIDDLTWEQILDWHLSGFGWGLLVQLNKFSGALDDVSLTDLVTRVMSGENSMNDIRTALRAATRYDADMEDALARLASGMSNGELAQFYRTVNDLGLDPAELDGYLESGASLPEIRHAASLADRSGADLMAVVQAHEEGYSWGEIQQAYRLADDETDAATILQTGLQEYRRQSQQQNQTTRQAEQDQRTAANLASQYGVDEAQVWAVYTGTCQMDWGCVRAHFRNQGNENPEKRNQGNGHQGQGHH